VLKALFVLLIVLSWNAFAVKNEAGRCAGCHVNESESWKHSDHDKAMDHANANTVLGDFSGVEAKRHSLSARFFQKGGDYFVSIQENNKTAEYPVRYVFGHYPLQQYLVEEISGQLQVMPFAWDTRDKLQGGQRWYANYQEDIATNDRLHWKQPTQNWNGMCADCHSTGLKRNFDTTSLTFNTHFDTVDITCASCHGAMNGHYSSNDSHVSNGTDQTASYHSPLQPSQQRALGQWLMKEGDKIARWRVEKDGELIEADRDNSFMDTCFGCHSLRSPLTDGINPDAAYLDQFTPSLLVPPLYFSDGQIREEVYVYGSFLQSRMYEAGVNCIDCHDAHSMKIKVEGNGLCLQCHSASNYDTEAHTHHPLNTPASQCVNCHMPSRTYMGVDSRRDHSFSIPTPHISEGTGAPNACLSCHANDNKWVSEQLNKWFGRASTLSRDEENYITLMHGRPLSKQTMLGLAYAKSLPTIKRATALSMLASRVDGLSDNDLRNFIRSKKPLLRLAAAQAGRALPVSERLKSYVTLLNDRYKSIRVTAVNNLVGLGINSEAYKNAFSELVTSNAVNQWRGEGNLNQSLLAYKLGNLAEAEALLKQGIKVDPYFEANYINLAELYRSQNDLKLEKQTLEKAKKAMPNSDLIFYSLGMLYIREQDKTTAIRLFKKATELGPTNPQNWYIYALALDNIGETENAIKVLKEGVSHLQDNSLATLGMSLSHKVKDGASLVFFKSITLNH
jgi:tetratricopeptide (TPR) repeat protein